MGMESRDATAGSGRAMRRLMCGGAVAAVMVVAGGCGDSTTENTNATSASTASSSDASAFVADAKRVVEQGTAGLIAAKDPAQEESTLRAKDFAPVTGWIGPTEKAPAPKDKSIVAISCNTEAAACKSIADGAVEAAKGLGWKATYIDGKGTNQGYASAFQTALNLKPDAIIDAAIPESVVQTFIAEAHAKGIKVICPANVAQKISNPEGHCDSYPSVREDSHAIMEALWVIADSNGTAKVAFEWDPGYPQLVNELKAEKKLFSECSGCKVVATVYRSFAASASASRVTQLTTSLLQQHPDIEYIVLPYGLNAVAVASAAKALGRDVKVVAKNADPVNVSLVNKGVIAQENGSSLEWSGWSAIDDVVRMWAGMKPLGLAAHNLPLHYFVKENAPASGVYDYSKFFDYRDAYLKLWGRG